MHTVTIICLVVMGISLLFFGACLGYYFYMKKKGNF